MEPRQAGAEFTQLRSRELTCTIGNNTEAGTHRGGYNGVFELTSIHQPESLFVPQDAGLNLEHVFDGSSRGVDRVVYKEWEGRAYVLAEVTRFRQ